MYKTAVAVLYWQNIAWRGVSDPSKSTTVSRYHA